jgi:NAD(P)-dependent dehydrogenase (short-subunit alcohol dehydrogenase family)
LTGFENRVALVTGAARGVGESAVRLLLDRGARVVAADRHGRELREGFAAFGDRVRCVEADVSATRACERLVEEAVSGYGALDFVFANAGITVRQPLDATSDEVWRTVLDVNLASVFRLARAAAPPLRASAAGAIVVNASINALRGNLDLAAYSAAKAGAVGLTRALAIELAADGVRVNAVCPGTLTTPMTEEHLSDVADRDAGLAGLIAKHPLGRLGTAEEVARVAVFLGSDEASFVTGVAVPVDGGRHVR